MIRQQNKERNIHTHMEPKESGKEDDVIEEDICKTCTNDELRCRRELLDYVHHTQSVTLNLAIFRQLLDNLIHAAYLAGYTTGKMWCSVIPAHIKLYSIGSAIPLGTIPAKKDDPKDDVTTRMYHYLLRWTKAPLADLDNVGKICSLIAKVQNNVFNQGIRTVLADI